MKVSNERVVTDVSYGLHITCPICGEGFRLKNITDSSFDTTILCSACARPLKIRLVNEVFTVSGYTESKPISKYAGCYILLVFIILGLLLYLLL
jgi:hypothetical protein